MPNSFSVDITDLAETVALAEALALLLRAGDVLAVSGDLGAGKTTLLRAMIQAFSDQPALEVPSPTFTLAQTYSGEGFRFPLVHADFYRLKSADELAELGLEDMLADSALLIEWPEKAEGWFTTSRLNVQLDGIGSQRKAVLSTKDAMMQKRLERLMAVSAFLKTSPCASWRRRFLQGDASPRTYERLHRGDETAVLLNALAQPDRLVGEQRLRYMKTTHLAPNDAIAPVLAIGAELRARGFSVPQHLCFDIGKSLLLQEDFGSNFIAENGKPVAERYEAAVDVLVHLHGQEWPSIAQGPGGAKHPIPVYDREAFHTEAQLFLDFFMPMQNGDAASPEQKQSFTAAFDNVFKNLQTSKQNWTLFDFHSPNAMWLEARDGIKRIGLLDFQDTRIGPEAYDLASIAQDARVDVPAALEETLVARYLAARKKLDAGFDAEALRSYYAICAAQRATRILGVFARLAHQDGKPVYLKHMPRVSDYLERCLVHPAAKALKEWFAANAPQDIRMRAALAA
ncbi:MAG: tRNA (adenosine(37)-N6)-threonylcarbamoyltransferase complex ATPase subunit type 1 TsaE [Pseudomonadota bacterium]